MTEEVNLDLGKETQEGFENDRGGFQPVKKPAKPGQKAFIAFIAFIALCSTGLAGYAVWAGYHASHTGPKNLSYRMSDDPKSRSIAPVAVWDDDRFTYFKFPANAELPTLFALNSNGKEDVVNATVMGPNHNILAAHTTSREWFIRFGDRVVDVVNDAFNPNYGVNTNGTISPSVRRVEVDGDDE